MKHNEYNLQCNCVAWFRLQYPNSIIFHIPNGERRDAVTGARLKRAGVVAGIPDLCIPINNGKYGALYIELKDGTSGKVSPRQKEVIDALRNGGQCVSVVRSFDEFIGVVRAYFGNEL